MFFLLQSQWDADNSDVNRPAIDLNIYQIVDIELAHLNFPLVYDYIIAGMIGNSAFGNKFHPKNFPFLVSMAVGFVFML